MSDETTTDKTETSEKKSGKKSDYTSRRLIELPGGINGLRSLIASVVWLVCVVFALVLAIAVLLIAIKANGDNGLVRFDIKFADHVDLHWFDLKNPIKDFDKDKPPSTDIKTALFNYGVCAIVWLVIGRIADRIIRPSKVRG